MGRHLKILEYAMAALLRRKFKNGAVVVAFTLTVASLASVLFLSQALKEEARRVLGSSPELIVQRISAGRHALIPLSYAETARSIPGVGEVVPRYWGYYYDALTKGNYTILGFEGNSDKHVLLEGNFPATARECSLGTGVAAVRGVDVGDDLILVDSAGKGVSFQVVGIFRDASSLLSHDLVLLTPQGARDFFGLPLDRATDIRVQVFNPQEVQTVAAKLKRALHDTRPITRTEILRTYDSVFSWRSGMMLSIFSAALIAFCILAWDKATGISAEERREIGVLKAVGWDTADVLELKFWEGIIVSLTSFLLGMILAYAHVFLLGAPILSAVMKGWSVVFPPFRLAPATSLQHVLALAVLTVLPYVASSVIPSWKAAVTDPDEVMRG